MIVVDTNVWSETVRPDPDPRVVAWIRAHHRDLRMPVVVAHELRLGVLLLPPGRRRDGLDERVTRMLGRFDGRILPYDAAAAAAHAAIRADAQLGGRTLSAEDGQILGIAAVLRSPVATRNVRDFAGNGVEILDPWAG